MVVMEEVSGGECDGPEADDQAADGEDYVAGMAVLRSERGGFAGTENLAADADGHEESAENESGPRHGLPFYLIQGGCWKRQQRGQWGTVEGRTGTMTRETGRAGK